MEKKNFPEINFAWSQDSKSKSGKHQKGMPTIRCVCGSRILVVPDLKAMNRAIKNHVVEHKQTDYCLAFDSLEEFLAEQILIVASEMNLPNVS
jgi:DNA-directed RNA polymerase subunit RPC12/RpoP